MDINISDTAMPKQKPITDIAVIITTVYKNKFVLMVMIVKCC